MENDDFGNLVGRIQNASSALQENAHSVINRSVTARAWLTGMYIVEYEQNGKDRAKYGDKLLLKLSEKLDGSSFSVSSLKKYRQFYLIYPQLQEPLRQYLLMQFPTISCSGLLIFDNHKDRKGQTVFTQLTREKSPQVTVCSRDGFAQCLSDGTVEPVPQMLFDRISYSHFILLMHIQDPLKRAFLAIETMRGPWSHRELKRQIASNYYERSGWSKKPELMALKVNEETEKPSFKDDMKSPYTFDFLGLSTKDMISENDIEDAIINNFQDFIMELGMGFCLESRQKKMLIDDDYKKADLVFYHRILKCHVLVELKAHELQYGDVMQLNMYIEYYRQHYMQPDDNSPIGMLLCTAYGKEMVEYLRPFTDPQLFIAKYELQLPSKEKVRDFLINENK